MARCGVRCEYEQVSLLVVTVERIRALGDPFRDGGQRQYMVPPEKTHETFVYCFAAAARFCRPGFRASGCFHNRRALFHSRDASFRNGSVLFRRRSVPLCSRGAPFCSRSVPLCSWGVAFRSRDAPFLSRGFFRFHFLSLVFRPRFFRLPPLRRFCCDRRLHLFSVRFRCRHMLISLPRFRLPGRKPPEPAELRANPAA